MRNTQGGSHLAGRVFRRAVRKTFKWGNSLRWRLSPPDYARTYHVRVAGLLITVLPGVFHPVWHLTSAFFANEIAALVPGPETRVLEVGTGTGVVALAAHRVARDVVAVDINPDAVRCARLNAAQNGLELGFEVLEGDMFSPLGDRRFGMILCNPPYFRGTAGNHIERAYYSGPHFEWIHRFAAKARPQLEPSGSLVCVLADTTDVDGIIAIFGENGWSAREVARRETLTEVLTLWQFRPSTSEEGDA